MAILETLNAQPAGAVELDGAEEVGAGSSLEAALGGVIVEGWDAVNVHIYGAADPNIRIGGLLKVVVQAVDDTGGHERVIEIDDDHRPFPEDVIDVLGAEAARKEEAGTVIARTIGANACQRYAV